MGKKQLVSRIIASSFLLFSVFSVLLVSERVIAALFLMLKFDGYSSSALDLGASSTVLFVVLALVATCACNIIGNIGASKGDRVLTRLASVATALYSISGLAILLMIQSGTAVLYCGR